MPQPAAGRTAPGGDFLSRNAPDIPSPPPAGTLRCGRSADTFLWVHTPDVPAVVAEKFLGDFKGDFFKNRLAAGLTGRYAALGALDRRSVSAAKKFLGESRGGFFQKAPSCARLRRAIEKISAPPECRRGVFFDSFFFAPEHPVNQSPSAVRDSFSPRRRTSEPALCKGRCRAERGGGVVLCRNYPFFCTANSALLQSLRR